MKNVIIALVLFLICTPVIAFARQTGGLPALQSELQAVQTNLQNQITAAGISAAVHGKVSNDGTIINGTGSTVTHSGGTGVYILDFAVPFSSTPDCLIQAITPGTGDWCGFASNFTTTMSARAVCLNFFVDVIDADTNTVVSVVGASGSDVELAFTFICVE